MQKLKEFLIKNDLDAFFSYLVKEEHKKKYLERKIKEKKRRKRAKTPVKTLKAYKKYIKAKAKKAVKLAKAKKLSKIKLKKPTAKKGYIKKVGVKIKNKSSSYFNKEKKLADKNASKSAIKSYAKKAAKSKPGKRK